MSASIFDFVSDELERLTAPREARGARHRPSGAQGGGPGCAHGDHAADGRDTREGDAERDAGARRRERRADLPDDRDRSRGRPPVVRRREPRIARGDLPTPGPGLTARAAPRRTRRIAESRRTAGKRSDGPTRRYEIRSRRGRALRRAPRSADSGTPHRHSPKWGKPRAARECMLQLRSNRRWRGKRAGRGEGSGPLDRRLSPRQGECRIDLTQEREKSASCLSSGPVLTNGPHPFRASCTASPRRRARGVPYTVFCVGAGAALACRHAWASLPTEIGRDESGRARPPAHREHLCLRHRAWRMESACARSLGCLRPGGASRSRCRTRTRSFPSTCSRSISRTRCGRSSCAT